MIIKDLETKIALNEKLINEKDLTIKSQKEKINEFNFAIDNLNKNHQEIKQEYKSKVYKLKKIISELTKSEDDVKTSLETLKVN